MAKIFSVNFNKGSVQDKYGATATLGATAKLKQDEKGLALKCNALSTDYITYGDLASINAIGTGEFSFVVGANIKGFLNHGSALNALFGKGDINVNGFSIYCLDNTLITAKIASTSVSVPTNFVGKNNIYFVTRSSLGVISIYLNGIFIYSTTVTPANISTSFPLSIGYDGSNTSRTPNASIYLSEVYNHCLSQSEINKLTQDFQNQVSIAKPKRGFDFPKSSDLSMLKNTGLTAAYNMKKNGNTLVDISGNGNNLTLGSLNGTSAIATKNGLLFNTKQYYSSISATNIAFDTKPHTHVCRIKMRVLPASYGYIGGVGQSNTGTASVLGINNFGNIILSCFSSPISTSSAILSINKEYTLVAVLNNATVTFYVDGVFIETKALAYNVSGTNIILGSQMDNSSLFTGEIQDYRIFNRALSAQEVKDYHNSFVKPTIIEDLSYEPADGTNITPREWIPGTGAYKVGEIVIQAGERVINGGFNTDTSWGKSSPTITIGNGTVNFANTPSGNGTNQTVFVVGKRYRITYEIKSLTTGSFRIGTNLTITGVQRNSVGVYSEEFSPDSNIFYIYCVGTTTGSIDNVSIVEIPPLKTLTNGSKYLECVTAGTIAIPSDTAFGTWEFDWYKGADANEIRIGLLVDRNTIPSGIANSYYLLMSGVEVISLILNNNGSVSNKFATASSYIANNTWYRIKITRTNAGVFTVLIKGGAFTPTAGYDGWTLVSTSGGSGTNPVTDTTYSTSNYLVLDLDAADRIANLSIKNGIKQ